MASWKTITKKLLRTFVVEDLTLEDIRAEPMLVSIMSDHIEELAGIGQLEFTNAEIAAIRKLLTTACI
ncbi:hypothetical protein [uncultured Duncaniella sp.]|uniref:hypothetical protein n=1 Tax=uncultured Duncaniella sp. TaxID=2768039 RepID=UPI00260CB9D2|nr:hypothetical protein [uncultured Duncaniella sp.]